ncbi:MAG: membrane transport protein-domain-containing protein [Linnemannia elongata]|nr:MAG: membrane transport protein-domain-containing protein [Linnemannia elongata]
MDWFVLAGAAAEAVSQVLVVVACGVILSRTGYLSQSAQKSISKVNLYFMTPCLLFTKIASTINWTQFKAFWPIPVFYLLFTTLSWAVARVGSRLFGFSKDEEKFVIASIVFSNTNSLPMALLQSLAFSAAGDRLLRDADDTREAVAARGISYILFYAIFGNLVRWSYGFSLLVPKDKEEEEQEETEEYDALPPAAPSVLINVDMPSGSRRSDASVLTLPSTYRNSQSHTQNADESYQGAFEHTPLRKPAQQQADPAYLHPLSQPQPRSQSNRAHSPAASISESILLQRAQTAYERISQVLTPPLLTALLALVVGLVPALHQLFMSPSSTFYRFFVRPIEGCGAAAIPMILLCLGAQVVHFATSSPSSSASTAPKPSVSKSKQKKIVPQTGLGIYTTASQGDLSSDDERSGPRETYGSGIATLRSHASSSATLLHFNQPSDDTLAGASHDRARQGSTDSGSSVPSDDSDDEAHPLLNTSSSAPVKSGYRISWITPIPFILFSRMVLVPVLCMPAILFHPDSLSPVLTTDPTFSLALVLLAAAPTAINMIQICQIKGFFEIPMASVLFWSYCVFGIPCVLGWSLVGLWAAGRE